MTERAVTNSTFLIVLERIGRLDLLSRVFENTFAATAVQAEFGGEVEGLTVLPVASAGVVEALKTQLDEGEASTIAPAMQLGDTVVILDEKKTRRVARQIGLRVIGTLVVLLRANRQGVIPFIRTLLAALQESGFHMTQTLHDEALRLAGE